MNEFSIDILKKLLANTFTIYLKTLNYHWNIRNTKTFFAIHKLLKKQYEELQEAADVLAECIAINGHYAPGTYSEFQKLTSIEDGDSKKSCNDMIKELMEDHIKIIKFVEKYQSQVDFITNDILVDRAKTHSKTAWMLKSSLENY